MKELCSKCFCGGNLVRLGDFIVECTERNKSNNCENVLSVSNKFGFIRQSEQFEDRSIASEDKHNYKVVKQGYFAYNPARINVGSIALLSSETEGIISPMYVCFKTNASLYSEYLNNFFRSKRFFKELQRHLEGSVRQCLTFDGLCDIVIPYVDLEGQKRIANTLMQFDDLILKEEKCLELLSRQKKFLLDNLFI